MKGSFEMKTSSFYGRLQKLTQKIAQSVYGEKEVRLPDGTTVTLGTLTSREEADAHEYASSLSNSTIPYMMHLKHDKLASAIKGIGDMELREDTINIGTEDGKAVTRPKRSVMREAISTWDETSVDYLYDHLGQLTDELKGKLKAANPDVRTEDKPELEAYQAAAEPAGEPEGEPEDWEDKIITNPDEA
jgi:hypothetical protein